MLDSAGSTLVEWGRQQQQQQQEKMAREARQKKVQAGQQTVFQVGLLGPSTLQAEDFPNLSVTKELDAVEKTDSSVSSVGAKTSMIPFSDGSKTGEELHDDRSESTNAKSIIRIDIECIRNKFPTRVEIDKYITIGLIPLPNQFSNVLSNQSFFQSIFSRNYFENLWY